jgi:ribulose 1,5-bisphosphate synthetase/thiazole synthase
MMTASILPVLVVKPSSFRFVAETHAYQVGGGPSGLAAAVTLLRNGIPVRIIDKESHYRTGQRANGVWVSLGLISFELNAYNDPYCSLARLRLSTF